MKQIIGLITLIFTLCLSLPAMAEDPLPAGIIAIAPDKMNWSDAKAYCASKGGRLPLIGGMDSFGKVFKDSPIDGFGTVGAHWPSGLPSGHYWTGTAFSYGPHGWVIVDYGGRVSLNKVLQSPYYRVVCVP